MSFETRLLRSSAVLTSASLAAVLVVLVGCPMPTKGVKAGSKSAIGLSTKNSGTGTPIAKRDGTTLTVEDIEARLNGQSAFVRSRFKDRAEKLKFVEQQVRVEVLAREAVSLGYHESPEVQDALKKIIVQKLTREKFDSAVRPQDITDAELAAYYEKHKDEYNKAEMVRLAQIFIPFGSDKAKALTTATTVAKDAAKPELLNDRKHFKELVAKHSMDNESKPAGGDLRYLNATQIETRYGPKVKEAAFAMKDINAVTGPIEGKLGFHIIKRTGHRKAINRTLEQVKNPVRNVLYRDKRTANFDKYVGDLKTKYKVQVFEDRIDDVKIATETRPSPRSDPHRGMPGAKRGPKPGRPALAPGQVPPPKDKHKHK